MTHRADEPTNRENEAEVAEESVGVSVPEDHVGAFVAQAFEDPERSTTWSEVVQEAIAPSAREAWDRLEPREQVSELLAMADEFDERAVDLLSKIPTDRTAPSERIDELFAEARRCRRNADRLRDGIADAYAEGRIGGNELATAVDSSGFETGTIAEREALIEEVTDVYDYDFRPYGGTLMQEDNPPSRNEEATELW